MSLTFRIRVRSLRNAYRVLCSTRKQSFSSASHPSTPSGTGPEPDLDYLCDPCHTNDIQHNIRRRKDVGDIDLVLQMHDRFRKEGHGQSRAQLLEAALKIPNRSHPEVIDLDEPRETEVVGQMPDFDFRPRQFHELADALDGLRTRQLGIVTGPRTYYLRGPLAKLESALVRYTLQHLLRHRTLKFRVISVPDLLHPSVIEGCGMTVKGDRTQVYSLHPQHYGDVCLSGTAEMALAGLHRNKIIQDLSESLCYAAVSRCYRAETSKVKEETGIYRVHQFTKVEMFGYTVSDDDTPHGGTLLAEFVRIQKELFAGLGLHFKVLDMPAHELGAPAYRKYDIEAWMPGRQLYGEVSSSSDCTDYQSRRLGIRYRHQGTLRFPFTTNGTACAVPRMLIALLETHQRRDRSVSVPPALRPFLGGVELLVPPARKSNLHPIKALPEVSGIEHG